MQLSDPMRFAIATLIVAVAASLASAQPANVTRTLKTIDFEERSLGNVEDLPMFWRKAAGEGLPHYVNGRLSTDRCRSGKFSFRFDLDGGSLIYRYDAGQLPVQAGAHYRVGAFVRTTPMQSARARLSAVLVDLDGHPLENTRVHSLPYADAAASDASRDWKELSVQLATEDVRAASLVIELELLQPALYSNSLLGDREVYEQDIRGSAWFDDVTVAQVPSVTMTTNRPGNVLRRSDVPRLNVLVRDRYTDDLAAQLLIYDAADRLVYQRTGGAMALAAAERAGPNARRFDMMLPDLVPGWYRASLEMSSGGAFVGRESASLVILPDGQTVRPDARFGVDASQLAFDAWQTLPAVLPTLGVGRVKLAVWNEAGDVQTDYSKAFDDLVEALDAIHIAPVAVLKTLPPTIANRIGGGWRQILRANVESWQPNLAYLVSRHANHLTQWQLAGGESGAKDFASDAEMRDVYARVLEEMAKLVQRPDLAMPWPAWYELTGKAPAAVALTVPPEVLPSQIPLYLDDVRNHAHGDAARLAVGLKLLSREKYGRELQIRDLAQRVAYTLSASAERIDLPLPFTVARSTATADNPHGSASEAGTLEPSDLFPIFRTLVGTLSGATFKGKVPLADGIDAFLFERGGEGILVMWDRQADGRGVRTLPINLGKAPAKLDLWGNASPLVRLNAKGDSPAVTVEVTAMPMFLTGIDPNLAMLRVGVSLDNDKLESSFRPHTRRLRFVNPYPNPIAGTIKLKGPAGWSVTPVSLPFNLNPGETFDREIQITFPYNSFAGVKTLNAEFTLQAERDEKFTVPLSLTLGLTDVGLQTIALRDGDGLVVQQIVTNYGDRPIDYSAFVTYPGIARQERVISGLAPGKTALKRYRFDSVPFTRDAKVRSGLKELNGTRVLNAEVEIQ